MDTEELVTIEFQLPRDKKHHADWLLQQSPDDVATLMQMAPYIKTTLDKGISDVEMARQIEIEVEKARKAHESELSIIETYKDTLQSQLDDTKEYYADKLSELQRELTSLKEKDGERSSVESTIKETLTNTANEEVKELRTKIDQMNKEYKQDLQSIMDQHMEALGGLTGPRRGVVGEVLLQRVFNTQVEVGKLVNNTNKPDRGWADFRWRAVAVAHPDIPPIDATIEAKWVTKLGNQKDIGKFENDVSACAANGSRNAAMLISLSKRIDGCNIIDVKISEYGLPILRASRDEDDAISADALIKLAFQTFLQIWPFIATQRQNKDTMMAEKVIQFLNKQLDSIRKSQSKIEAMHNAGAKLQRDANAMKAEQEQMMENIMTLKDSCSDLQLSVTSKVDVSQINLEQTLKQAMLDYRASHSGHCKNLSQLDIANEVKREITDELYNSVRKNIGAIYKEYTREKVEKRKAVESICEGEEAYQTIHKAKRTQYDSTVETHCKKDNECDQEQFR